MFLLKKLIDLVYKQLKDWVYKKEEIKCNNMIKQYKHV